MGFGGEEGGGVNLINNKSPSAPQSHALCLIALYWFFALFFFSFLGRALLSFWNNQVAKVDLEVECHLFSLLPHHLLLLLHPLTLLFFLRSPSWWCLFVFHAFCGFSTVKVILKWLWTLSGCLWKILISTTDCIHSRKWSFYSQAYCILHVKTDGIAKK